MQYPEGTANDWCQVQDSNSTLRLNRRSPPMSYLGMASIDSHLCRFFNTLEDVRMLVLREQSIGNQTRFKI